MVKKIKSCVFISGKGTNLLSLIKNSRSYDFPIKIQLIISNKKNAAGIKIDKAIKLIDSWQAPFKMAVNAVLGEGIAVFLCLSEGKCTCGSGAAAITGLAGATFLPVALEGMIPD